MTEADLGLEPVDDATLDAGHGFASLSAGLIGRRLTDATASQSQPLEPGLLAGGLFARKGAAAPSDLSWIDDTADKDVAVAFEQLRQGVIALTVVLGERESALAQARLTLELAQSEAQQNADTAVSSAEAAWKTKEAARLALLEAEWREKASRAASEAGATAESVFRARETARITAMEGEWRDRLEKACATAAATAASGRDDIHKREVEALRDTVRSLEKAATERETALLEVKAAAMPSATEAEEGLRAALAAAEAIWQANESARFAAAETRWREQTAVALRDATGRARAVEQTLAQERERAKAARETNYLPEVTKLREELAIAKRQITERDRQVSRLRTMLEQGGAGLPKIVDVESSRSPETARSLEATRSMVRFEPPPSRTAGALHGVLIAAVVGIAAVAIYSFSASMFDADAPAPARPQTVAAAPSPPTLPSLAEVPSLPEERRALVVRSVNMRGGPSAQTEVIGVLASGMSVAILEEDGNWRRVRIDGAAADQPAFGWIFRTFLDETGGTIVQ